MTDRATYLAQGFVKIRLTDDGYVETLWARRTEIADRFRLDNSPFFAYRVSADDLVEAALDVDDTYDFVRVVERSGNRTLRIAFEDQLAERSFGQSVLDGVQALGCSYEGMHSRLIAVTVPPQLSLDVVASYLTSTGVRWEYADPKYEDLFGTPGI